jgi:hypothetical protein
MALVNTRMNLRVPYNFGKLAASQKGLGSMELVSGLAMVGPVSRNAFSTRIVPVLGIEPVIPTYIWSRRSQDPQLLLRTCLGVYREPSLFSAQMTVFALRCLTFLAMRINSCYILI